MINKGRGGSRTAHLVRAVPATLHRHRVLLFSLGLALSSVTVVATALPAPSVPSGRTLLLAALLVPAFTTAEALVLHFEIGDSAHSASLTELPLVLGLFWLDPATLVVSRLLGALVGLGLYRRQSSSKLLFNLSSISLEVSVALVVFATLTQHLDGSLSGRWASVLAACLVSSSLGSLAVLCVISLSSGRTEFRDLAVLLRNGSVMAVVNSTLALVAVEALEQDLSAVLPLLLLGSVFCLAYRGHVRLRKQHDRLSSLYGFVRGVSTAASDDGTIGSVLVQTRELLKAEVASLTLVVEESDRRPHSPVLVQHVLHADGSTSSRRREMTPDDWAVSRCLSTGEALLAQRGTRDRGVADFLAVQGVRDGVLVPVRGDGSIAGALFVGSRRSEHSTFEHADVLALEGLAGHAAVALRNAKLVDRLTHESRHDALTGLPNRTEFENRLAGVLSSRTRAAVLFMDLDRFKDVNDTLGHHAGDRLLEQVAHRLRTSLDLDCTVARLGGDEFAVVLPDADEARATHVADTLQRALEQPVGVEGMSVDVGVSVGVALAPQHGTEAGVLMRRADIAMYAAKASHRTFVYDQHRDDTSASRLALVAQLREALQRDEFLLHFQPQVQGASGRVERFEALIRWQSPTRGLVPPDEFIPVAERAGLLQELTGFVLRTALDAVVSWRQAGFSFGVAVNLSPRNLLDPNLASDVRRALRERSLPAEVLTLEITEGTIMAEPERALETLAQLRATGVRLSIDDFGTGYSSLAYLKQLPVDEVKIDKSFVRGIADDDQDLAIVQAVVTLAASLRLEVVAEGVEDERSWDRLAVLGCDSIQGYHVSRPLPSERVVPWLREYTPVERSGMLLRTLSHPSSLPAPRSEGPGRTAPR
ncbi:MAG: putative Diguanylate cyclase/phosphodiesterase [Frankiales bacterium]|nr:putative Diguanylate cyclase/phosphodiesterase [Frankiales bacterium]